MSVFYVSFLTLCVNIVVHLAGLPERNSLAQITITEIVGLQGAYRSLFMMTQSSISWLLFDAHLLYHCLIEQWKTSIARHDSAKTATEVW